MLSCFLWLGVRHMNKLTALLKRGTRHLGGMKPTRHTRRLGS